MKYIVDIEKGTLEGKLEFEAENEFEFSAKMAELITYLILSSDFEKLNSILIRKEDIINESYNV